MSEIIALADLGVDKDPGREWHPDKAEAYDADGLLVDLSDEEVAEHREKPERFEQVDAAEPLAAEDSVLTGEGEI